MEADDIRALLKGTTWKVYKYILENEPTGIRELQKSLKLSTPSLALYHLSKLERAGIIRKNREGYMADQVFLQSRIKVGRLLVPRHFFYSIFATAALIIQSLFFRPNVISRDYAFSIAITCILAAICVYETVRTLVNRTL